MKTHRSRNMGGWGGREYYKHQGTFCQPYCGNTPAPSRAEPHHPTQVQRVLWWSHAPGFSSGEWGPRLTETLCVAGCP